MLRKIFTALLLILILFCTVNVSAKDKAVEIPIEQRLKIFVDVADVTNFVELETNLRLREMLIEKLRAEKIFNVIDSENVLSENIFDAKTLGDKKSMADVGELFIFAPPADMPFTEDEKNFYESHGVKYVVKCTILGLGAEQIVQSYNDRPRIGIGIGTGSHRHSGWGIGIGADFDVGGGSRKRNVYCAALQVQFINAETGVTLWRYNLTGQAELKKKPSKGYDDAHDEAYLKALQDVTKNIVKRVTDYSQKFLVKQNVEVKS
ncbi:MAG: hypothetical protein IJU91_08625 [Selenomonadaceae bacterium]|nr:hypothetical protein [Selenomonadaceae bacterium]